MNSVRCQLFVYDAEHMDDVDMEIYYNNKKQRRQGWQHGFDAGTFYHHALRSKIIHTSSTRYTWYN